MRCGPLLSKIGICIMLYRQVYTYQSFFNVNYYCTIISHCDGFVPGRLNVELARILSAWTAEFTPVCKVKMLHKHDFCNGDICIIDCQCFVVEVNTQGVG